MASMASPPVNKFPGEMQSDTSELKSTSSTTVTFENLELDYQDDPMRFSAVRRWTCTFIVVGMTAMIAFASSIHTAAVESIANYFHVSRIVSTLGVTTFLLGFGSGPLIFAPCSEEFGRNAVYQTTFFLFLVFNMACALAPNIQALLVFRCFAGFLGSPAVTNSGASLTDMWSPSQRSVPLALFTAASFLGPVIAPIIGGFISQYTSWRWNYWLVLILSGIIYAAMIMFLPETYHSKLKRNKAKRLGIDVPTVPLVTMLKTALVRPWIMLWTEPILFSISFYMAFLYGILYLDFSAYPYVFEDLRHWQPGLAGLSFLGIGVGMAIATACSPCINKLHAYYVRKLDGPKPEARLPHLIMLAWCIPIGLFWFAWTSPPSIPWPSSIVSGVPFGIGFVTIFLGMNAYMIDCYGRYAASALAANALLRSVFGAVFPLFSRQMYEALGPQWATSVLGFVAAAMAPLPLLFFKFGPWLRERSKFHRAAVGEM